jgi:hypothetical protein
VEGDGKSDMISGISTTNITTNPILYKDLAEEERFAPVQIELRNISISDAGNPSKRKGYLEKWDVGSEYPIIGLIPLRDRVYAVNTNGEIYILKKDNTVTDTQGVMTVHSRPRWSRHNERVILVAGAQPIFLSPQIIVDTAGSPTEPTPVSGAPAARFVSMLSSYTIMSGHSDTEVRYSAPGNPLNWTGAGSGFFNTRKDGDRIRHMIDLRGSLLFFKDNWVEVWGLSSNPGPFSTRQNLWIEKGCGADDSVVKANNTVYWYGNDGDFYTLSNNSAVIISKPIRKELDTLHKPDAIYGIEYRKDNIIRWFAPFDGKCFVYDYNKNLWWEDNGWQSGDWGRLPIYSYLELGGNQYVGDYNPTGKVYEWSSDHKDDDGQPIRKYQKFRFKPSATGNRARFNRMRLRVKRGHDVSGNLCVRWRPDQRDWSNERLIDLGALGDRNPYIDIYNMGVAREMEIEITETDAVDCLLTDLQLTTREYNA